MLEKLRNFPDELRREIARRKAHRTAIKNGQELFRNLSTENGYTFLPSGDAFFYVYRPGSQTPAYDIQVYCDKVRGEWTYLCGCPACSAWGMCKHGVALVLLLESSAPVVRCALNAPRPPQQRARRPHAATHAVFSPGEGMAVGSHIYHPVRLSDRQFAGYTTFSTETPNHGGFGN